MKSANPPALATWLLEHLRFSNTDDALAGDLLEEFNQRRSAAWYWRQALVAILTGFMSEVRHHKVLAIRAIGITWAAQWLVILLSRVVMVKLFPDTIIYMGRYLWGSVVGIAVPLLAAAVSTLIVATLHRRHRNAMLLICAGALFGSVCFASLQNIMILVSAKFSQSLVLIILTASIIQLLITLTGFVIGGFLLPPAPKTDARSREHESAAY